MGNEWTIGIDGFGIVRISKELIDQLVNFRQIEGSTPESGGVLVGKHLNSNGTILIDNYTPPQPTDKQGRCQYYRSGAHNELIQTIWRESNHQSTYVGLWHTHAEPIPSYSPVDKKDWINALKNSIYEGDSLFFFIIGQTHIRIWKGTKKLFRYKIELIGEMDVQYMEQDTVDN